MKLSPMHLPWDMQTVPHAVVDVIRGCNISCRACCNAPVSYVKPVAELEAELDALQRLRPVSSIALMGGEVLLHPEIGAVVRAVKARDLYVEVCTNGVTLDAAMAAELKQAGADIVYIHVEKGQHRPDLADDASPQQIAQLRTDLVELVADHGMDVGLSMTAFAEDSAELQEVVRFAIESPHVTYLLVTLYRDVLGLERVEGDLYAGMTGKPKGDLEEYRGKSLRNDRIAEIMWQQFGIEPFGCLGSNLDRSDLRWLSYLVGSAHPDAGEVIHTSLRPSLLERFYLWLTHRLTGRYPMYQAQNPRQQRIQTLLNGLLGGALLRNLRFLWQTWSVPTLRAKRILFQNPASLDAEGRVIHCSCCPDAVLKQGHLVPVCIMDRVVSAADAGDEAAGAAAG